MSHLDATRTPGFDDADALWDQLAAGIDAFLAAWQRGEGPPDLAKFVPAGPPAVRRMALVELAKVDMDCRRRGDDTWWSIERYFEHFPELAADGNIPCDLVYEEYHLRRAAGEPVAVTEYLERFPQQAEELRRLMNLDCPARTTSLFPPVVSAPLSVGETVDDFDLLVELGAGAFATVFLARQRSLQRLVALKASADAGTEPQTLAQLEHPHIVRVYDQRVVPERDVRLLYMQYVPGGTLQNVVQRVRAVPPQERTGRLVIEAVDAALARAGQSSPAESPLRQALADCTWPQAVCRIGAQLASALSYAHRRGVLHRDLKPANVLMSAEGAPRLADFNISFCSKLDGANPAAYFGGSLAYMSPEQLEACSPRHDREPQSLDGRSDIFALGVVLWELLAGERPFDDSEWKQGWSETLDAMLARRRRGVDRHALARLPADMPPGLTELLLDCLRPDPNDRPPSAETVAERLRLCQHPEAQQLMQAARRGWRVAASRACEPLVVLIAAAVNAAAAWFNFVYNRRQIVDRLPEALETFWKIQGTINGIAFPVGIAVLVCLCWPVGRALRQRARGAATASLGSPRRRALALGHMVAAVGIVEWLIAGISYPASMHAAGVPLGPAEYLHFLLSLTLCGLIAATYPFFGVTWLTVNAFYPALVGGSGVDATDTAALDRLARRTWTYLVLAASVPMLGVMLLVSQGDAASRPFQLILSGGSVIGFGLIFYLARAIQADLATLRWIVRPAAESESAETGSFVVAK